MSTQTLTSQSYLATREGRVTCYVGPDAVKCFNAIILAHALKCYITSERQITPKHWTALKMLKAATKFTGIEYKRGEQDKAARDVIRWADEMKAALPKVEE